MPNYKSTRRACYVGYITQAIACNLAPIFYVLFQDSFGISRTQIGEIVLVLFVVQLLVDILSVTFVKHIGCRGTCLLAHGCAFIGLVMLSFMPYIMAPFVGIIISVAMIAVGSGLVEVMISPVMNALPNDGQSKENMALLHSFYCIGQSVVVLISTLILKALGNGGWNLIPILWSLVPLVNFFAFLKVPLVDVDGEEPIKMSALASSPMFIVAFIVMICSGASELAMSQWASYFAEAGLGVSKVIGDLLGPCLFAILMAFGRIGYAFMGKKVDLANCLIGGGIITIASYLLAVLSPIPVFSLMGCAFCGLGVSMLWPGVLSLSAETFTNGGSAMFALLALGGDIGCSVGPFLTGVISDTVEDSEFLCRLASEMGMGLERFSVKLGLLAVIVFPVIAVIGTAIIKKNHKS